MSTRKLFTLCELEWLTFRVNWPPEVTLELPTIRDIYQVIIGTPGHPNQFLYSDSWLQVAQPMSPWVWFCASKKGQSRVFVVQVLKPKDQKKTKPVLQGDPEDELPVPLPYIPSALPPSEQSVPPLPDCLPPSVSPPQPCQQPPSPNNFSHPSLAWSPSPQPLNCCLHSSQAPTPQPRALQIPLHKMQGPSRLVLMAQSSPDALSSITSLWVQLTS
jgi:hypothetical protein